MSYYYMLTIFTVLATSVAGSDVQAQTRVHEILQERQQEAREHLEKDVNTRGNLVKKRTESQREQENSSIALSREQASTLKDMERAYQREARKYQDKPADARKNAYFAYEVYKQQVLEQQRAEMACTLIAINEGREPDCAASGFDERKLARDVEAAANGAEVTRPQGSGTLRPGGGNSIRIGGNAPPTGGNTRAPNPPATTSGGNTPLPHSGGGGRNLHDTHQLEMR